MVSVNNLHTFTENSLILDNIIQSFLREISEPKHISDLRQNVESNFSN